MTLMYPKPTKAKKARNRMQYRKPEVPPLESAYMAAVAKLPCCICGCYPVDVHHCFHGRFSQKKAGNFDTIPLCDTHHQGKWSNNGIAIHKEKALWREKYGPDTKYIPQTREAVMRATGIEVI